MENLIETTKVELNPQKVAKAFHEEAFKVPAPEVTLHDFQIESLVDSLQRSIKELKEQATKKDSGMLELIVMFLENDLNRFKASVKKAVLKGETAL